MIFDVDDLYEGHDRMDLLQRLKDANPAFRLTAFVIPGRCSSEYLESLPGWIELVPHGWMHGDPPTDGGECRAWSYDQMMELLERPELDEMAAGFKAPGWQISDGCYQALLDAGYWVADQSYNDHRRPAGLRFHCEGDGDHVHTHVQNVCGNGLEERFGEWLHRVRNASSFELISEVVRTATVAA